MLRYVIGLCLISPFLHAQGKVVSVTKFSGDPYVEDGRRLLAEGEAPQYYRVQEGDTLFDICDQLIDEADYWPKLWALNPDIQNPHFIYPGMLLRFYPGDAQRPPFLEVVEQEDVVPFGNTVLDEVIVDYDHLFQAADLVKTEVTMVTEEDLRLSVGDVEEIGSIYQPSSQDLILPAFYLKDEPQIFATAVLGTQGEKATPEGQNMWFANTDSQQQSANRIMSVLRATDAVENVGMRYEFVAHVKTLSHNSTHSLVRVLRSRLSIQPGDMLVAFTSVKRQFQNNVDRRVAHSESAVIIGMEYASQHLGGTGSLVFIDKSLPPGMVVPVYNHANIFVSNELRSQVASLSTPVAYLQSVGAAGESTYGIIISSVSDVRKGDHVGSM